jgi:hypothetical protein
MPGLHKFDKNILGLSKTKNVDELHLEWVAVGYEKTDGNDTRCICSRWIKYVYYFYNHVTNRTIAVGTACADKLKEIIGRNGKARSVVNLCDLGLKPGIYTEITDLEAYSEEIRRQICALLRVHLGRCDAFELVDFIENPKLLLNDAGLIAYAKERLAELEAERKEKERQRQQQFDAFLETMRLEREARESAERLEKEREEARIQALQMEEELSQIDEMRDEWGNVNRIVKTADELKDEEEMYEAQQMLNYWSEKPLLLKSNIMLLLEKVIEKHLGKMEEDKKQRIEERRQRIEERRQRILEKDKDLMNQALSWAEKMMRFNTEHGI